MLIYGDEGWGVMRCDVSENVSESERQEREGTGEGGRDRVGDGGREGE